MNKEYELKSEEVLDIIEKYREKLNISRSYLNFDDRYDRRYVLRVIFRCDYTRYNYETIHDGELTIDFTKGKNIIQLGNWVSGSGLVFNNLDKIKSLISMAEELQAIDYLELNEFKEYIALKDKKRELKEQQEKLRKELESKQQELENKIKELENLGDEDE